MAVSFSATYTHSQVQLETQNQVLSSHESSDEDYRKLVNNNVGRRQYWISGSEENLQITRLSFNSPVNFSVW